ncbi:MAG: hypothetical protein JJE55_03460 [Flavobacteriaceae bacterium]|nr:hypothetical protein [Flavobacteriaceae bacterium]
MKHVEKHISSLLVSIAILLVFGNVAFASEGFSDKSRSAIVSELQKDDHKPFVFHEISIGEVSQTVSQNEYTGLGFYGTFCSNQNFSFVHVSSLYNSSYSLKDKRELIFRHLFPFHFFW